MKEDILDVLLYLFENYLDDDNQLNHDEDVLRTELLQAGFEGTEVSKAFAWLEGLSTDEALFQSSQRDKAAIRVYTSEECERIDIECRGFLLFLEQVGVIEAESRELIIDRAMALETEKFGLDQLKWITLLVLFNQPGYEAAFAWMEDFVIDESIDKLH